jgi:hypothetical protein
MAQKQFLARSHNCKNRFFRKSVKKMCFAFLYKFLWNISHSTNNSARYYHKCQTVFMLSTRYSCRILTKLGFARQFFAKSSNITFHEKPSSCGKVVPCEQTDRHEVTSRFAVLRTRPKTAEMKQHSAKNLTNLDSFTWILSTARQKWLNTCHVLVRTLRNFTSIAFCTMQEMSHNNIDGHQRPNCRQCSKIATKREKALVVSPCFTYKICNDWYSGNVHENVTWTITFTEELVKNATKPTRL